MGLPRRQSSLNKIQKGKIRSMGKMESMHSSSHSTPKVGFWGLKFLWHFMHFVISVCFFFVGLAATIDSYLVSSGMLKRYKTLSVEKLRYLAIVVDSEEARQTSKVIEILKWLSDIGVRQVCLYDEEGVLKKSKGVILERFSHIKSFEESDEKTLVDQGTMILEIASSSDGKEAVARAANLLFKEHWKSRNLSEDKGEKIFTEAHLAEALRAVGCRGPEPDLLLVYGPARCHLGFPAWRLRYTEIVHMGTLRAIKYGSLRKVIYQFTLVRQNYGK